MISERVVLSHNRKETEALLTKLLRACDLLTDFAKRRKYPVQELKAEARNFWDEHINERRKEKRKNLFMGKIAA